MPHRGTIVAALLIASCREPKESPAPAPAAPESSGSARAIEAPAAPKLPEADAAVAVPALPALDAPAIGDAVADFDRQTRDPAWAPKTEKAIRERFAKVRGGKLQATECRESACRLEIAGSEGDIGQAIADLESPRGMHGFAKTIILSAPERKPDGTVVLRATATFER